MDLSTNQQLLILQKKKIICLLKEVHNTVYEVFLPAPQYTEYDQASTWTELLDRTHMEPS